MTHTPTTAAIVTCSNPRFQNDVSVEDPEQISMSLDIKFNGTTGELGDPVTFSRNATQSAKQAAVRQKVNDLLLIAEPTLPGPLSNANIQIIGLPV